MAKDLNKVMLTASLGADPELRYTPQGSAVTIFRTKGARVYVEGWLRTNKWQDKETGQDRYSTEVIAGDVIFLSGQPRDGDVDINQEEQAEPAEA